MPSDVSQEELNSHCTQCRNAIPLGEREVYYVPSDNALGFDHVSLKVLCLKCGEKLVNQYESWLKAKWVRRLVIALTVVLIVGAWVWIKGPH